MSDDEEYRIVEETIKPVRNRAYKIVVMPKVGVRTARKAPRGRACYVDMIRRVFDEDEDF